MKPISQFPKNKLRKIKYLLTDIDDTITQDGLLPATSLSAMERLQEAKIAVVPITGRPAGWCDHISRMWPVQGVVGENGAFYFSYDREKRAMLQIFAKDQEQRVQDRLFLDEIRDRIQQEIPGAGIASDQDYRIADLAIDFCEDVPPLATNEIGKIVQCFEDAGATAKVSSIHVNGWFGQYDKLSMTRSCLGDLFSINIDKEQESIVYLGDSPNDSPMFAFFDNSVGVANVADFELGAPPTWITTGRSAEGFLEFVDLLLEAKSGFA